jgi:hypothetical protein
LKYQETSLDESSKKELDDIKEMISKLYLNLNVEHYEKEREQKLLRQLEAIKLELEPMEKVSKK